VVTLSSEPHPTIQRNCALFAAAAGPDSHSNGDALDDISQADFLLDKKARKTDAMQGASILFLYFLSLALFPQSFHLHAWLTASSC
jgi:hypothetical protein